MIRRLIKLFFGNKGLVKDPISQLMEENNPQRLWDPSPPFKDIMAMHSDMRDIPVSTAQEGWNIRDALNKMEVQSWFPKPGDKSGLVVRYNYSRDLSQEEINTVLEKYGGVSPDRPLIVAEEPSGSQGTTVVKRSSEDTTTEPQVQIQTVNMADVSKTESDLMKQGFCFKLRDILIP